jgi:hypothetical protein
MKKIFEKFTNQYELSKTLRFELKPIEKTKELLEKNQVFQKDKQVFENYQKTKKYFDKLHCNFIDSSLKLLTFSDYDYKEFQKLYFNYKQDRQRGLKAFNNYSKKLRTKILQNFEKTAQIWQTKYIENIKDEKEKNKIKKLKGLDLLFKTEVFNFLKFKFSDDKNIQIFNSKNEKKGTIFDCFNKFSTYFINFHQSRKNFYKDDGTQSSIPTRIIDVNLPKFLDNKNIFENKYKVLNLSEKEKEIFHFIYFNNCFTQRDIEKYNEIIGEINSKINKYRQKNKENKIPFLKELFKQILFERSKQETEQDEFISIENDEDVFKILKKFIEETKTNNQKIKSIFTDFIHNLNNYDLEKIFIKGGSINTISNKWFTSWDVFGAMLPKKSSNKNKISDFVSIKEIKQTLENQGTVDQNLIFKKEYFEKNVINNAKNPFDNFLAIFDHELKNNLAECTQNIREVERMILQDKTYSNKKEKLKNGKYGEIQKEIIKDFAESALNIYQIKKYFALEKSKKIVSDMNEDSAFYNKYNEWLNEDKTYLYYNEFRNYLTKKPYSKDKIKLNFECGYLLSGWATKYETYKSLIFKKNENYYLGIIGNQKLSEDEINQLEHIDKEKNIAHRMIYDFQKPDNKNVPRLFIRSKGVNFSPVVKELNLPVDSILDIYDRGLYKTLNKNNSNYKPSLIKLIDYFKLGFKKHPSYKHYNFKWKKSNQYENIAEFYQDTISSCYTLSWEKINFENLKKLVKLNKIYLFQIYSKDFQTDKTTEINDHKYKKRGKDNLHTSYFKLLFDKQNLESKDGVVFKLSGGGEIFYRKASIKKEIDKNRKASQVVIKNNRYTEDKIFLHFPIQINYTKSKKQINLAVNKALASQQKQRIIGIDRGEKHLLYISAIDENGNIIKTKSLNQIEVPNKKKPDDYHKLLDEREKSRDEARKSWQEIEKIKDLKQGYISQVVHEISKLIFQSLDEGILPIIVFEDLNIGFKRGRFKIEKQVYQKFELALAQKLNYLASKSRKNYLKALQLTPPIQNFQDIKKQTGIIFYIPASFTSAICPVCGFRKQLYGFTFKNIKQSKKILTDHDFKIKFEKNKFNFECLTSQESNKNTKNKNELFAKKVPRPKLNFNSDIERLINIRSKDNKKWKTTSFDPTKELLSLFENKIDPDKNIVNQITISNFEASFYKQLIFIINAILKLRNFDNLSDRDFIACPNCYFHSDKGFQNNKFNGDANGAYNIARKGILITKKIKQFSKDNSTEKLKPFDHLQIQMQEWDKFVQKA